MFLWFNVQEHPKAQLAVVLVLKCLIRRGHGLKSHPTDWEKPEVEPEIPVLQGIGLSPTPRRLQSILFTLFFLYPSLFYSLFLEGCTINFLWFVTQYIFFQIGLLGSNSISVKWPIFVIDFNYVYKTCTRMTSGNELAGY